MAKRRGYAAYCARMAEQGHQDAIASQIELDSTTYKARHDTPTFRLQVCNHDTLPHQQVWVDALNTKLSSPVLLDIAGEDTLILAPRDSAKSTFLLEWLAQQIGRHAIAGYPLRIVYVSYKQNIAQEKALLLQRIIDSSAYQAVFPTVRPGKKWSEVLWEIDWKFAGLPALGEPYTFASAGLTGAVTSHRADLIVFDDLIKSDVDIKSPTIRAEMISNYRNAVLPLRRTGGRLICLGTLMRNDDIYSTEFTHPDDWATSPANKLHVFLSSRGWRVIRQPALIEETDGTERSYWEPDYEKDPRAYGMPLARLQLIRSSMFSTFSYQYQNQKLSDKESQNPIQIQHFQQAFLPHEEYDLFDCLVVGCDLASSLRPGSCYSTMVLGGFKRHRMRQAGSGVEHYVPRFQIIDSWEGKIVGNIDKLDTLLQFYQNWKHKTRGSFQFRVENNAYQNSLMGDFDTYVRDTLGQYDIVVKAVNSRGKISDRLQSVSGLFQNRLVWFNPYCSNLGKLKHQLLTPDPTVLDTRRWYGQSVTPDISPEDLPRNDLLQALILCLQGLRELRPLSAANWEDARTRPMGLPPELGIVTTSPAQSSAVVPSKVSAVQLAIVALQSGEEITCTAIDYKKGIRKAILNYAAQHADKDDLPRRDRAIAELNRLDKAFGLPGINQ